MGVGKESIVIQLQNFVSGTFIFVVYSFNLSRMFFFAGGLYFFQMDLDVHSERLS